MRVKRRRSCENRYIKQNLTSPTSWQSALRIKNMDINLLFTLLLGVGIGLMIGVIFS